MAVSVTFALLSRRRCSLRRPFHRMSDTFCGRFTNGRKNMFRTNVYRARVTTKKKHKSLTPPVRHSRIKPWIVQNSIAILVRVVCAASTSYKNVKRFFLLRKNRRPSDGYFVKRTALPPHENTHYAGIRSRNRCRLSSSVRRHSHRRLRQKISKINRK